LAGIGITRAASGSTNSVNVRWKRSSSARWRVLRRVNEACAAALSRESASISACFFLRKPSLAAFSSSPRRSLRGRSWCSSSSLAASNATSAL
jgi:hypothetical protein